MRIMFAFIARQWRLATPLFLTALTAVVIGGMALAPASAHTSHDRPVSFSGYANGVRGSIDTQFNNGLTDPFVVSSAKWTNCATGNVEKHGTSHLGPVTSGQPLIDAVALVDGSASVKFLAANRCGAEVTSKLTKHADGVGSVFAHAALDSGDFGAIFVDDVVAPSITTDDIDFATGTLLASSARAFCTTEGTAQVTAGIMPADANDDVNVAGGSDGPQFTEFNGTVNQPVDGLEGTGFSATINEVTMNVSGSHGSITVTAFHLTGNGIDLRLAESHANISCPK